ncbi:exonuclease SbcCD subunit D [Virgibacillus sp. W0181]|uniref:exonuclease SbcCD subunit D n=1 Tax=Virgibacillus sp. W0181 TaxID=3391581 RepID=UPI003F4460C7
MKIFHTADWHLGKLVQGIYMTEDQEYILDQFLYAVKTEKPDAVIIAGDLYDRAVPPTEAVHLLNNVLETIVLDLETPVLAIAGNHDSPSRLHFASSLLKNNGLYIVGQLTKDLNPVVLHDEHGEVHFHLIPYCDPSVVRHLFQDEEIITHNDAARKIVEEINRKKDPKARHVYVGHAFITPYGEVEENTSDSERPLSIGGAEYVNAQIFSEFHYTALGHLHQAHVVSANNIRYAGSILKYSISEEHHRKGFYITDIDKAGGISVEKCNLVPKKDMRTVEASMDELLTYPTNEDYVFVRLVDETAILSPMEKIRSVFPNAMHVERKNYVLSNGSGQVDQTKERTEMSDLELFKAFYKQVKGFEATEETESLFKDVLNELLQEETPTLKTGKDKEFVTN